MFPKLVSPIQPCEISNLSWIALQWNYVGPGNYHELELVVTFDYANAFVANTVRAQIYLSTGAVGWYDTTGTVQVLGNGTSSVTANPAFGTNDPTLWTQARLVPSVGGFDGTPSPAQPF